MMKSKLENLEKSKQVTADLMSYAEFSASWPKCYSKTDFYLKSAFFAERTNKVLENLVKCVDDQALAVGASTTEDHYVRALVDQDMIAREAYYHSKGYEIFIKNNKSPPTKATITTPYKEAELVAFKEVLQKCYELCKNPQIVAFPEYSHEISHGVKWLCNERFNKKTYEK